VPQFRRSLWQRWHLDANILDMTDARIGTELAGYRIESVVGRGGMSVVYLAEQDFPRRKVALKLLSPELAEDSRFRERFVRESNTAASIEHPNIVPIYGAGQVGDLLYIAMRFIRGTDLKAVLEQEGTLEPERAVGLLAQAAGALDAAHERGLVHRDVKPANLLISPGSRPGVGEHVYLADFGLTKRSLSDSGVTGTGQFVGTLDYAAPEQFEGKTLDGRTDVYSLGCVLYACLTGHVPYGRDQEVAVMYAHLLSPIPSARESRPELPAELDAVLARAMAKSLQDRFATCVELIEAARDVLGTPVGGAGAVGPAAATVPAGGGPVGKVALSRLKRPQVLAAFITAVLLVVAGVVIAVGRSGTTAPGAGTPPSGGAGPAAPVVQPNSIIQIDPNTNRVVKVIPVGNRPGTPVDVSGSLWVINSDDGTLYQVDPTTGAKTTVSIPTSHPDSLISDGGSGLWISTGCDHPAVEHLDAGTLDVSPPIPVRACAGPMALGGGYLWVINHARIERPHTEPEFVTEIDLKTSKVVATVEVGSLPTAVTYGFGSAWVTNADSNTLSRIDGTRVTTIHGPEMNAVAIGQEAVWVILYGRDSIGRIDPIDNNTTAVISGGRSMSGIVANDRAVWVSVANDGNLLRIDPATNKLVKTIYLGLVSPGGISLGADGTVWVGVTTP